MADRYSYIPSIGLFVAVVWGVASYIGSLPEQKIIKFAIPGVVLAGCCFCTTLQIKYWKNSTALFRHAVNVTHNNLLARIYLGYALITEGSVSEGLDYLQEAARLAPRDANVQARIADGLTKQGKFNDAIAYYRHSIDLDPNSFMAMNNLAWILAANADAAVRNGAEAVRLAERACELNQYQIPILIGTLADAYAEAGRFKDAEKAAQRASELAESLGEKDVAARNQELRQLYLDGKAFHEQPH